MGKGLISYHSGNITFAGLKKLQGCYKVNNVGVPVNHKHQLDILRGQIIRFNLSAQGHSMKKSGIQIRKKGFVPLTRSEKINSSYVGLSSHGIGNLFCMSKATGSRLRLTLTNLQLLTVKKRFSVLYSKKGIKEYIFMKKEGIIPPFSFYIGGRILIERRPMMEYNWERK
jgi:hypothetical protein